LREKPSIVTDPGLAAGAYCFPTCAETLAFSDRSDISSLVRTEGSASLATASWIAAAAPSVPISPRTIAAHSRVSGESSLSAFRRARTNSGRAVVESPD
jgi:hypothetical protein